MSTLLHLLCTAVLVTPGPGAMVRRDTGQVRIQDVRAELTALADDSMEGRRTGTAGGARAARYIAGRMAALGLQPAGDDGYLQTVPLARSARAGRRGARLLLIDGPGADTFPPERRLHSANVVGLIPGSDPTLRDQAVVIAAHYDHLGIGAPVNGDSIYNGADDDASGVVAVLEIARALEAGPAPRRTVLLMATTGEELGLLGTRYYLQHPVVPLAHTVAELEVEMIARPDSLAGGAGRAWLTGYDRSTMGRMLHDHGIPIVADPRPAQHFFQRSDNIAFARLGIPAHTLSTFNLHRDYHRPSDEVSRVDFPHMTAVIEAAIRAVRLLADGPAPQWLPGGQPH